MVSHQTCTGRVLKHQNTSIEISAQHKKVINMADKDQSGKKAACNEGNQACNLTPWTKLWK